MGIFKKIFSIYRKQDKKLIRLKKIYNIKRLKEKQKAFCWAPFTALRFNQNGYVQVCCHHVDFQSLKKNSLREIWFGNTLNLMREQMKTYSIPSACNFCASNFFTENFDNVNALSFDHYAISDSGYPVFMDFSIDNTCNLACIMCDASLSSKIQLNKNIQPKADIFRYDEHFIQQLEEFIPYLKGAVFTGGEPFLINSYYDLWEKMVAVNPDMNIYITTNGTVFNSRVQDALNKGRFNITVSIDSFRKEVYEKIRIGAVLENTLDNLTKFSDYCKSAGTQFNITICPMQINWAEIPQIVERCNSANWNFNYNIVFKPWHLALWSLPSEEINQIVETYKKFCFSSLETEVQRTNSDKFKALIKLLVSWIPVAEQIQKNDSIVIEERIENKKNSFNNILRLSENNNINKLFEKRIEFVLERIPLALFSEHFSRYLSTCKPEFIQNEFNENDDDTIADHLTAIAFHLLLMRL